MLIVVGSKVVYKDNFAILTGVLESSTTENGSYQKNINYPEGFNQNNCIVISHALDLENSVVIWGTGNTFDSSGFLGGAMPSYVCLRENDITIEARNIRVDSDSIVTSVPLTGTINYKIVLMKIGD